MDKRLIKIGEASALLGVDITTLRRWEATGELLPTRKSEGGTRFYLVSDLIKIGDGEKSRKIRKKNDKSPQDKT